MTGKRVLPDMTDHTAVLRALVKAIDEEDKCPLCGDNQDHHPECIQGRAKAALESLGRPPHMMGAIPLLDRLSGKEPDLCGARIPGVRHCHYLAGHEGPHG